MYEAQYRHRVAGRVQSVDAHEGRVVANRRFRSTCQCGFRGHLRRYVYEALQELLDHYRDLGRLMDEAEEEMGVMA